MNENKTKHNKLYPPSKDLSINVQTVLPELQLPFQTDFCFLADSSKRSPLGFFIKPSPLPLSSALVLHTSSKMEKRHRPFPPY